MGKYLKYAIGEVILVMIGILLALQVNNWNELRKQKQTEIAILKGIKADILKDTVDLNFNIRAYKSYIKSDSLSINYLMDRKKYNQQLVEYLERSVNADWIIVLHDSRFYQAKLKGLSIISNEILRNQINDLYEFDYKGLVWIDNESERFNSKENLNRTLGKYFILEKNGPTISKEGYNKLLNDKHAIFQFFAQLRDRKELLDAHMYTKDKALKIADNIEQEIKRLE